MQHRTLHSALLTALLLIPQVSAHFLLNYPNTVGFSDDKKSTAPCGGFTVTFDNATDFRVDGDAIAVTSTHPQAEWLFRATLDKTGTGDNFTNLLPVVSEAGLGSYCETGLTVPGTWAGKDGVIQVIQHGPDGSLFQVKHPEHYSYLISPTWLYEIPLTTVHAYSAPRSISSQAKRRPFPRPAKTPQA